MLLHKHILKCIPITTISIIISNSNSSSSTCSCNNDKKKTILGFGFCGVDYIAKVAKYPEPDEKIRTLSLSLTGGGNCGNTMSTVGILGSSLFDNNNNNIRSKIITKIADDSNGHFVKKGMSVNTIIPSSL